MKLQLITSTLILTAQYCTAFMLPPGHAPQAILNLVPKQGLGNEWQEPGPMDKRSPCPALNTLANHGYLNRNGQKITAKAMQDAMTLVYNLSPAVGALLANAAVKGLSPNGTSIDLDRLQQHGFIEHDASLVHQDSALAPNWIVDKTLLFKFISMGYGGYLNKLQIGRFRAIREKESLKKNPQFSFGTKERLAAYGEAGLLWTIFNVVVDGEVNGLRVEDVVQFLGEEKLPLKYQRPAQPVELKEIVQVGREIYRYSK